MSAPQMKIWNTVQYEKQPYAKNAKKEICSELHPLDPARLSGVTADRTKGEKATNGEHLLCANFLDEEGIPIFMLNR